MKFLIKTLVIIILFCNVGCEQGSLTKGNSVYESIKSSKLIEFYNKGILGEGVTVAILDTGVAPHTDIRPNLVFFKDFVNGKDEAYDDNGHGTNVAGIIAGTGNSSNGMYSGVAPSARIIVLKVFDNSGQGDMFALSDAVDWLVLNQREYDIRLVSMSFGFESNTYLDNSVLKSLIDKLWENNMIVVSSSGNNGLTNGEMTVPSIYQNVISVGSLKGIDDKKEISNFTSLYERGERLESKPDLYAPGENIITISNDLTANYIAVDGTSFASAIIVGELALILQQEPTLTNKQILNKIETRFWSDMFIY